MNKTITPVLLGADLNCYNVARAFHMQYGVKSYAFGRYAVSATKYSKIINFKSIPDIDNDAVMLDTLHRFADAHIGDKLVLFGCTDDYVAMIIRNREELSDYIIPYPSEEILNTVSRKAEFYETCDKFGIPYAESDIASPKTFHAKTGAALAREKYPELCDDFVYNCIRYHTTGRANMTLAESILYLADYIEPTRTFSDCISLRNYFYNGLGNTEKHVLLRNTLIMSFDMTVTDLVSSGRMIDFDTIASRNHLLMQRFD